MSPALHVCGIVTVIFQGIVSVHNESRLLVFMTHSSVIIIIIKNKYYILTYLLIIDLFIKMTG